MDQTLVFTEDQKSIVPLELVSLHGPNKGKRFPIRVGQNIRIGSAYFQLVHEGEKGAAKKHSLFSHRILLMTLISLVLGAFIGGLVSFSLKPSTIQKVSNGPVSEVPQIRKRKIVRRSSFQNERLEASRVDQRQQLQSLVKTDELDEQARMALANGQFEQASQLWKQILSVDPNNQRAQEGLQSLQQAGGV